MEDQPSKDYCPLGKYKVHCRFLEDAIYALLISQRFKSVYLKRNGNCLDAYMVPDNKGREFMLFVLDELPSLLQRYGIEFEWACPHSAKATRQYYPEIYTFLMRKKK